MPRYAIYYCPAPSSSLWQFGSAVLGYDSYRAVAVPYPKTESASSEQFARWSERPKRYGFHATLKAPFHLRASVGEAELQEHVKGLSASLSPVVMGHLEVTSIGPFVALIAPDSRGALTQLSSTCVDWLEPIRAPLSETDRARRLASELSPRQIELLDRYGYPFVHDEFRFHMTLTGSLDASERSKALDVMKLLYSPINQPSTISAITLVRQDHPAAGFVVRRRYSLPSE